MRSQRDDPERRTSEDLTTEVRVLLCMDDPSSLARLLARCDWTALDRLAREQRLTGRLLGAAHQAAALDQLPPQLRVAWRRQARRHAAIYRQALGQLDRLATAFSDERVRPTLLKGPVLVLLGLRRSWERPFGDLDLLVNRSDVPKVSAAMTAMGYHQQTDPSRHAWARSSHYHDPRWYHSSEVLPVELHWDLLRPDDPLHFDVAGFTTEVLPLPGGRRLRRPDDAELLTHVCLHFWGDRAAGKPRGVAQLWDVADLAAHLDYDAWERFWSRAAQRGHTDVLTVVLALVRLLLDRKDLDRFPAVAGHASAAQLRAFALRRVCRTRPAYIQLLSPYDDVNFGVGRHLKQRMPWMYGPRSPLRWWPGVALTRIASAALRSGTELGRIYGVEPSVRVRLTYLWQLSRLLAQAALRPRATAAELRVDRWSLSITPRRTTARRQGVDP